MYEYRVQGFKNCLFIQNHFLNYPLMTHRLVNFKLWCDMLDIIQNKSHLTTKGLIQLINIKSSFPNGLTDLIISAGSGKKEFEGKVNPVSFTKSNPIFSNINYNWLAGFLNTDGSFFFFFSIQKKKYFS